MKTAPYNYGGSIRGTELTLQYKIDSCLNSRLRVTARRIVRSAAVQPSSAFVTGFHRRLSTIIQQKNSVFNL